MLGCAGAVLIQPGTYDGLIIMGYPVFRQYFVGFHLGDYTDKTNRYVEFAPYKTQDDEDTSLEVLISYREYVTANAGHTAEGGDIAMPNARTITRRRRSIEKVDM